MRQRSAAYSGFLHLLILLIAYFGLPDIFHRKTDPQLTAISVEIVPLGARTNLPTAQKQPEPKEEPKETPKPQDKPEPPKEEPKKEPEKPLPKTKTEEAKPAEPEKVPLKPVKKEEKKPEEKKEAEKKKKPQEESLDAVLKSVKDMAQKSSASDTAPDKAAAKTTSKSSNYNPDEPLSMSEIDFIRSQIAKCWSLPAGAKDAHTLIVVLQISLQPDGSVTNVELAEGKSRYMTDSFFRAAADAAIRAVHRCSPLKNLPPDKYGSWGELELNFDPREMLY